MAVDNGITKGGVTKNTTVFTIIIVFISIALYNVVELHFMIFATFRKRGGLYFWSFCISTWGVALCSIGYLMKDIEVNMPSWAFVTILIIGWLSMVNGQSMVLYSRLHFILRNQKYLRLVLAMIITNAFVCGVPTIIMTYGANSSNPTPFIVPYSIYEKVQLTLFFLQECILSSLYIQHTIKFLLSERSVRGEASRRLLWHLVYINIMIVLLDMGILALEYSGLYDIQTAYKPLVYAIKLKLEFSILNRLVEFARNGSLQSNTANAKQAQRSSHLHTFSERLKAQIENRANSHTGYRAYIYSDGVNDLSTGLEADAIVVSTTRVAVRSETRTIQDEQGDLESGRRASKEHVEIELDVPRNVRTSSRSSSKIRFAREGC